MSKNLYKSLYKGSIYSDNLNFVSRSAFAKFYEVLDRRFPSWRYIGLEMVKCKGVVYLHRLTSWGYRHIVAKMEVLQVSQDHFTVEIFLNDYKF